MEGHEIGGAHFGYGIGGVAGNHFQIDRLGIGGMACFHARFIGVVTQEVWDVVGELVGIGAVVVV